MGSLSKLKLVLSALLVTSALAAQTPVTASWTPLLDPSQNLTPVKARVITVDGRVCLQFRNDGLDPIHFQFGVQGDDPIRGPRIHLHAQKRSAFLPLPAGVASPVVTLGLVRTGADQAETLPD